MIEDHCSLGDMGAVILRYFNAAGADPDGEVGEEHDPETHLIPLVLQAAAGTLPHATIYGDDFDTPDGTCVRDYLHVSDIAAAHVAAIEKSGRARPSRSTWAWVAAPASRRSSRPPSAPPGARSRSRLAPGARRSTVPGRQSGQGAEGARLAAGSTDVDDMIGTAWRWMVRNARPAGLYAPD